MQAGVVLQLSENHAVPAPIQGGIERMAPLTHYSMLNGEFITWHPVEYLRLQFLIISDHGFSLKVDLTP